MSTDPRHPFEIARRIISYPFPLSTGQIALLTLPKNLCSEDAIRLEKFIQTLVPEDPS